MDLDRRKLLRTKYQSLLSCCLVRQDEVKNFSAFLISKTNWQEAIASKRGEISLLEHSVVVAELLLRASKAFMSQISEESLVICGLFHDVGKLGGFDGGEFVPRFLQSDSGWRYNAKLPEVSLGARSLYLLSKFVSLSDTEVQAIISTEGEYSSSNDYLKYKETPLTLLLRWSDYYVAHVVEKHGQFSYNDSPWFVVERCDEKI